MKLKLVKDPTYPACKVCKYYTYSSNPYNHLYDKLDKSNIDYIPIDFQGWDYQCDNCSAKYKKAKLKKKKEKL